MLATATTFRSFLGPSEELAQLLQRRREAGVGMLPRLGNPYMYIVVECGEDPNIQDATGKTALHYILKMVRA